MDGTDDLLLKNDLAIKVTHINSPENFWAQISSKEEVESLDKIEEKIHHHGCSAAVSNESADGDFDIGDRILTFGIQGKIIRARVIGMKRKKVTVQYLDYGITSEKDYEDIIWPIPKAIQKYVEQSSFSYNCKLHNVTPSDENSNIWDPDAVEHFRDLVLNQTHRCDVVDRNNDVMIVDIKFRELVGSCSSVSKLLVEQGYAVEQQLQLENGDVPAFDDNSLLTLQSETTQIHSDEDEERVIRRKMNTIFHIDTDNDLSDSNIAAGTYQPTDITDKIRWDCQRLDHNRHRYMARASHMFSNRGGQISQCVRAAQRAQLATQEQASEQTADDIRSTSPILHPSLSSSSTPTNVSITSAVTVMTHLASADAATESDNLVTPSHLNASLTNHDEDMNTTASSSLSEITASIAKLLPNVNVHTNTDTHLHSTSDNTMPTAVKTAAKEILVNSSSSMQDEIHSKLSINAQEFRPTAVYTPTVHRHQCSTDVPPAVNGEAINKYRPVVTERGVQTDATASSHDEKSSHDASTSTDDLYQLNVYTLQATVLELLSKLPLALVRQVQETSALGDGSMELASPHRLSESDAVYHTQSSTGHQQLQHQQLQHQQLQHQQLQHQQLQHQQLQHQQLQHQQLQQKRLQPSIARSVYQSSISPQQQATPFSVHHAMQQQTTPLTVHSATQQQTIPLTVHSATQQQTTPLPVHSATQQQTTPLTVHSATQQQTTPLTVHQAMQQQPTPLTVHHAMQQQTTPLTVHSATQQQTIPFSVHHATQQQTTPLTVHSATQQQTTPLTVHPVTQQQTTPFSVHTTHSNM